jgi:hypothetical protein
VTGRPGQGTFVTDDRRPYAAGPDERAVDALYATVQPETKTQVLA